MKTLLKFAGALAIGLGFAGPALADNVCLDFTRIDTTHFVDPKTLDFRMKDGTVCGATR